MIHGQSNFWTSCDHSNRAFTGEFTTHYPDGQWFLTQNFTFFACDARFVRKYLMTVNSNYLEIEMSCLRG